MGFDIEPSHIHHLQGAAHGLHLLFHWSALSPTCTSEFEQNQDDPLSWPVRSAKNLERAWRSLIQGMEASSRFWGCPLLLLWDVWYTSARPEISSRSRADESITCSGTACSNLNSKGQTSVSGHDPNLGETGSLTSSTPSSENWLLTGVTEGTSSPAHHSSASALWLPVEPTLEQGDRLEALRNKTNCKQTFLFVRKIKQQNATLFYTGKTGHNRYS